MLTVLEDVAFRVDGLRVLERLSAHRDDVVLDLAQCTLVDGLWALPAIDGIADRLSSSRFAVRAPDALSALLVAHLRSRRHHVTSLGERAAALADAVWITFAARATKRARLSSDRHRLLVPSRSFPERRQHAWGHWVDGARACGFDAVASRPRLRLADRRAARAARRWIRERVGVRGRTLVALLPSPTSQPAKGTSWGVERFAAVGRQLASRLGAGLLCDGAAMAEASGAIPLGELDLVTAAHVLALSAVALGDADGLVHLAAAAGAPCVSLHGDAPADLYGAASLYGVAITTERCRCPAPRPSPRGSCLECLPVVRVVEVAEKLAAERWPWDRFAQAGLLRTSLVDST